MRRGGRRPAHRLAPSTRRARDRLVPSSRRATGSRCSTAGRRRHSPRWLRVCASTASSWPTSGTCCSRTSTSTTQAPAGAIVREHPHVQVHVSAIGAPHLVDPSRLEASARRLYGSAFDELWGELVPCPGAERPRRRRPGRRSRVLRRRPDTHRTTCASRTRTDTLYAGDAAESGSRRAGSCCRRRLRPTSTSPRGTRRSTSSSGRAPKRLALAALRRLRRHRASPGRAARAPGRVGADRRGRCDAGRVRRARARGARRARRRRSEAVERAMPMWQSYAGLKRWVEKIKPSRSPATASA